MTDTNQLLLLHELKDCLDVSPYAVAEGQAINIPIQDIRDCLMGLFPNGYEVELVSVGAMPDGTLYAGVNLKVQHEPSEDDPMPLKHCYPGAASSNNVGLSGVVSMAVRNAAVSGLGLADTYFKEHPITRDDETANDDTPSERKFSKAASQYNGGGRKYGGGAGGGGGKFTKAWDGSVKVKTGEFAGTPYSKLPQEVIESWAAKDVKTAVMELERREQSDDEPASAAQSAVKRSPFRR